MKIALFTDTYHPQTNGVVSYMDDAMGELAKRHEIVLFAPGERPFRKERVSKNFSIYWIPSSPFPLYEGYRIASLNYRRVSRLLAAEKPDIVHAHAPVILGLQGVAAAKATGIPVVITYHTHFPDYLPHLMKGKLPGVLKDVGEFTLKKMIKHSFKNADVVTAPTRELVKELRSYGLRNVTLLPNGVLLEKLRTDAKRVAAFRNRYALGGKKVALYLGRVSFEKRLEVLLEAFGRVESKDAVLLIAGSGPHLAKLRQAAKAKGLGNVVFTGFLESADVGAAYAASDIFVSASDTETFGLTFVEAMNAGLPLIGVNRLGAKEMVRDGKNGLLVEAGDAAALAHAIDRLLGDAKLRQRMSKAALRDAPNYSIANSVRRTVLIYRRLLRKGD